jgi:L-lactate dehydrogenase complex protein LldF
MSKNLLSPEIKENIWQVVLEYRKKREQALSSEKREELAKEIRHIKRDVFANLEAIKSQAIANLEKNKIKVIEVKDDVEARYVLSGLCQDDRLILKSKSNIADEIGVSQAFNGKELVETDLGNWINQILGEEDLHPVIPAFHIAPQRIVDKIYQKFGRKIEATPEAIAAFAREKIHQKIVEATVGITGANAITKDGKIVLLENEGNVSLVSRWPQKHIIISSIEKLVPDLEAAMKIVKASAVWGTGQDWPTYVSIVSGPSKTSDVQNKLVIGAQGPKQVYLILVDNGRSRLIKEGFVELLYCLNCGACLNFCPVFHNLGRQYGDKYLGSKGIIFAALSRGLSEAKKANAYACTLCSSCFINCPVIDLPELMKKVRQKLNGAALSTEENKKMIANLEKYGNPFGELGDQPPGSLFCC